MASASETGHAKNVAHFQNLIALSKSYGAAYNPSRKALQIASLEELLAQAQAALLNAKTTKTLFDNATNNRRDEFTGLKKLSIQVVSAFAASGVPKLAVADAKINLRKMQGRRAKAIKTEDVAIATTNVTTATAETQPETDKKKHISVSQVGFDNMVDHFAKLVETVSHQQDYNPNEQEFTGAGLQEHLAKLNSLNTAVIDRASAWHNARISRNDIMYHPVTGLVQVSADVKLYIKSIFGNTSPQFKRVQGLRIVALQ